jgi:hypothetical protein
MGYLLQKEASLGGMSSAIISFWVKCSAHGDEESIDSDWVPPAISQILGANQVAFGGSSYRMEITGFGTIYNPAHIWCYPFPGPDEFSGPTSWKDGLVPFLTFGDPDQPFNRVEWKLKKLNTIWLFGKGGAPQDLMSQYPEKVEEPEKGIVPPSCIGAHNGNLRVILQTSSKAKYTGCAWAQDSSQTIHISSPISCQDILHNPHPCSEPEGYVDFSDKYGTVKPNQFTGYNFKYNDVSGLECTQHPEAFIMDGPRIADGGWHHVVISFDLTGKAAAGGQDAFIEYEEYTDAKGEVQERAKPRKEESQDVKDAKCEIKAESTGPDGDPPLPGTWGQYSGADGEYALAPARYIINDPGYPSNVSYAGKAAYGAPFEEVGKYGPATGGTIKSSCRGWMVVDGQSYNKGSLNHKQAYNDCKDRTHFDDNAMAPPNAFLIPGAEIRTDMTTNKTGWERDYRTLLGGFNGPAAKIDSTDEPRRYDYVRPSYELTSASIPIGSKPFAIPGGPKSLWGKHNRNYSVTMAELHIWTGKWLDLDKSDRMELLLKDGRKPGSIGKMDKHLGKPNVRLHWSTHWINGKNTGSSGVSETGPGAGTDPVKKEDEKGKFVPFTSIDRAGDPSL